MKLALFATLCSLSLAGSALAAAPTLAACKKAKFKAEYSCHEEHVNPRGIEVGTCGRTQVVNTYQSGVAGNTLVSQVEVKRTPTAHPGMSATFTAAKFNLYINRTVTDKQGKFPSDLTDGKSKFKMGCSDAK